MREWVRRFAFLLVLSVLPCASAWAQFPPNCTVPACIMLVGTNGFVPDPAGLFTVTVRDLANNPMPNVGVMVELINVNDVQLCPSQPPDVALTCTPSVARRVCALTNLVGVATFTIYGRGFGPSSSQGPVGQIWANATPSCVLEGGSVLIANVSVSAIDLNGDRHVGAQDLSQWLTDFGSGELWSRSDFDCSGSLGANDFSLWLSYFGTGGTTSTCDPGC